jgi:hypothetical protein
MPMGMFITPSGKRRVDVSRFVVFHIGVGFVVARSTEMGNAKASNRGTSDQYGTHAFSSTNINVPIRGAYGTHKPNLCL